MMKRESGYYWVKHPITEEWVVSQWIELLGLWTEGFNHKVRDDYWLIIDERRLVHRE